ncbi:MAG: hypothetical protein Q9214_005321 [Letrouitia sp. 1 TL-2023]
MAYCLSRLEHYTEAITAYQEVLEVYETLPEAEQAIFYRMTLDLAKTYYNVGQYSKALDYSQRAFEFYRERLTEDCPIVWALSYLGLSAAKAMKWEVVIGKCINMLEKLGPPKDNNLNPKEVLSIIFTSVVEKVGKELLLSKNEEAAAKCYSLVMKYWIASEDEGDHAAVCDGCETHSVDEKSIKGTRYICRNCEDVDFCEPCMLAYDQRALDVPHCQEHQFFAIPPLSAADKDFSITIEEQIAFFTKELKGIQQELLALEPKECKLRKA